jgi:hypothetical protein
MTDESLVLAPNGFRAIFASNFGLNQDARLATLTNMLLVRSSEILFAWLLTLDLNSASGLDHPLSSHSPWHESRLDARHNTREPECFPPDGETHDNYVLSQELDHGFLHDSDVDSRSDLRGAVGNRQTNKNNRKFDSMVAGGLSVSRKRKAAWIRHISSSASQPQMARRVERGYSWFAC